MKASHAIFMIMPFLAGCLYGEPRKQWDLESSRLDQELTIKKITSPLGSPEREQYEERLNDLNYKWWFEIGDSQEEAVTKNLDEEARIRQFNKLLESQLQQNQARQK